MLIEKMKPERRVPFLKMVCAILEDSIERMNFRVHDRLESAKDVPVEYRYEIAVGECTVRVFHLDRGGNEHHFSFSWLSGKRGHLNVGFANVFHFKGTIRKIDGKMTMTGKGERMLRESSYDHKNLVKDFFADEIFKVAMVGEDG